MSLSTRVNNTLLSRHFGDGPPHWLVGHGRPWVRPCDSAHDARRARKAVVRKLRWHGRRTDDRNVLGLADTLAECRAACPCCSGACPFCVRALQRLFVERSENIRAQLWQTSRQTPLILSVIPDFGAVRRWDLVDFDLKSFRKAARDALSSSGISVAYLGLDVSLNEDTTETYFQLQLWGLIGSPDASWRELLKTLANGTRTVERPIQEIVPRSWKASAAYAVKSTFNRRVSFLQHVEGRTDRRQCQNTRNRLLRGPDWVNLMILLDRIGLSQRLLKLGVK